MAMASEQGVIPVERIERAIYLIRGQKVILDKNLAILYQVSTKNLNKAVSRNLTRFPEDFMFQLSKEESNNLKFQFGTSSWGGARKLPRAFTEQGVAMLSGVLRSAQIWLSAGQTGEGDADRVRAGGGVIAGVGGGIKIRISFREFRNSGDTLKGLQPFLRCRIKNERRLSNL